MTRVLVTGGAGFIGSHTVDLLLEKGYSVRVLDNLQPRVHPKGKPEYVSDNVEFIIGDVANFDDMARALAGVELVVHLAAYQDYQPDFSRFIRSNTESAALVFELIVSDATRFPVSRIVFASSQSVSGEGKYACDCSGIFYPEPRSLGDLRAGQWDISCPQCGTIATPQLIDEATCTNPHTAYAISKYATELLAFNLGRRYGIATAAMRYTYVQGPRNSLFNAYSGVARRFATLIRHGRSPTCYEDGQQLRDYVNVADVARANVHVLESDSDGLAFNVGGGRAVSVLEFARVMLSAAGSACEPSVTGAFRVGDTRHTVSDLARIRGLGWEPIVPVEQSVREYLDWFDDQETTLDFLIEADRAMADSGVIQQARHD